jgi:cob(I)alamin adenosyltransferase
MKIYTKTGDQGESGLFSGERVKKTSARLVACGTLDECNSHLGLAAAASPTPAIAEALRLLQPMIFELGTDLATIFNLDQLPRITEVEIRFLETEIDRTTEILPPLQSFIIPGGSPCAAHLHVARTVCRRAEREVLAASEEGGIPETDLIFLNRLSDYLFVLARHENLLSGHPEIPWKPAD